MYICPPNSIKHFSSKVLKNTTKQKQKVLPGYLASIVLNFSRKTSMTSIGKTLLKSTKFKTTVSQFFRGKYFHSQQILQDAIQIIIQDFARICSTGTVVLALDGCCFQRGSETKIENAIQYRRKKTKSKGRSTKAHTFLLGLIILPNGFRLPAPRYTYYTKSYCKKHDIDYKTQHDLAVEMIREVRSMLPASVKFVVLADSFFDSKQIFDACNEIKAIFITPADSARVHSRVKKNGKREKLHERAKNQKRNCRTVRIKKGQAKYVKNHIRFASGSVGKKEDTYRATSELLDVSRLGKTRVVYSWKMKTRKIKNGKSSSKVLLCNDVTLCDRQILELYALRWQVEIFFRELKSDLGAADFAGQYFDAFERFLDLVLLSYLYLEWKRHKSIEEEKSPKVKGKLRKLRTRGLIELVREEAHEETISFLNKKAA